MYTDLFFEIIKKCSTDCIMKYRSVSKEWKYICEITIRQREESKVKYLLNHLSLGYTFESSKLPFRLISSKIKSEYYVPPPVQYKCAVCNHPVYEIGVCNRLHITKKIIIKKVLLPVFTSCIILAVQLYFFQRCFDIRLKRRVYTI